MKGLTSNSLRMMERSLEFLWAKQAAHLDNLANAETPGYRVKTVTFEEDFQRRLQAAQRGGRPRAETAQALAEAMWTVEEDPEAVRMDDNGVNVNEQSLELVRTAYQMQYAMQAISSDLSRLGRAING